MDWQPAPKQRATVVGFSGYDNQEGLILEYLSSGTFRVQMDCDGRVLGVFSQNLRPPQSSETTPRNALERLLRSLRKRAASKGGQAALIYGEVADELEAAMKESR